MTITIFKNKSLRMHVMFHNFVLHNDKCADRVHLTRPSTLNKLPPNLCLFPTHCHNRSPILGQHTCMILNVVFTKSCYRKLISNVILARLWTPPYSLGVDSRENLFQSWFRRDTSLWRRLLLMEFTPDTNRLVSRLMLANDENVTLVKYTGQDNGKINFDWTNH